MRLGLGNPGSFVYHFGRKIYGWNWRPNMAGFSKSLLENRFVTFLEDSQKCFPLSPVLGWCPNNIYFTLQKNYCLISLVMSIENCMVSVLIACKVQKRWHHHFSWDAHRPIPEPPPPAWSRLFGSLCSRAQKSSGALVSSPQLELSCASPRSTERQSWVSQGLSKSIKQLWI